MNNNIQKIERIFADLNDKEIVKIYPILVKQLKKRSIIRTKNVIGDLGEKMAIDYYNSNKLLPDLKQADPNEKAYDAMSGLAKYTIKSTSSNQTGIFWGLEQAGSNKENKKIFDYLIIVKFDNNYELEFIYEMTWGQFIQHKKWHSMTKAWNIRLSKRLISEMSKRF